MYEYPPILRGTPERQLADLRDYLVRLANATAASEEAQTAASSQASPSASSAGTSDSANASSLKSLIVKTADRLSRRIRETETGIREEYLALSDFGSYLEQIESGAAATARGVVESYAFDSALRSLDARGAETERHLESLRGEIRRGLITDPVSGETAMGIAIAEQLRFTGATVESGGETYYELSPGQTLGLYTSSGWQFWVGGQKRGWFDSADGSLHVVSQQVDSELRVGAWRLSGAGGFGLKYLGN